MYQNELNTNYLTGQKIGLPSKRIKWMMSNINYLKAFAKFSITKLVLGRVNIELSKIDYNDDMYIKRINEFNVLMLKCSKARWYSSMSIITKSKQDWKVALNTFNECIKRGKELLQLLENNSEKPLGIESITLQENGTEIEYYDNAPVVPETCPVVILQGNSFEMGYQYAQQIVQIFGKWVLEKKTKRQFQEESVNVIKKWEEQIKKYTPEIIEMCHGWAKGANDIGIEMSYLDVLEIWTGHLPPKTTYMGRGDKISDIPPAIMCSGAGAWGKASKDSKLVTGSSGDHDPSFPVVIMAYPDTGNNFMFTTFSAVGDITLVGSMHMFGFPGINNKGLAYIEHGGQPRLVEPKKYWGYGLRRAASVLHILRFADSAKEAQEMELAFPIGDAGMDNGTVGGFFADSSYGYVLESRKEPIIIRETGYMGETDFMFANNSGMHKDMLKSGWMKKDQEIEKDWKWNKNGGWYPENVTGFKITELFKGGEGQAISALRGMYNGSFKRNLYHYNILSKAIGKIDFEYMKMIYRKSGTIPKKSWKEITKDYNKYGKWGDVSVGNANNGVITITKPDNGDNGIFAVCIGQAKRGLSPNSPFLASFCPMYNESNSFWEGKLADKPENVAKYSYEKAKEYLEKVDKLLSEKNNIDNVHTMKYLSKLVKESKEKLLLGKEIIEKANKQEHKDNIYKWSLATRLFNKSQIKSLMVHNILVPPPQKPENLNI